MSPDGPVTELRLAPEELGHVRIDLRQEGDRLVMTVAAERQDTLDLLRRHAGELAAELRAAGHPGLDLSFGRWSGPGAGDGNPPGAAPEAEQAPAAGASLQAVASLPAAARPDRPGGGLYLRI
nr:flagellar hook-length control protein FliK [Rhodobacter sp. SGA-6-6]